MTAHLVDLRGRIPGNPQPNQGTVDKKYGITIHYNGPPVKLNDLDQLTLDARYHMRPNGFGPGATANGIQYEYAVGQDGTQYRLRNPRSFLWHAAHPNPNQWAYSITFLIGDGQRITRAARDSMAALCERLMGLDGFGRDRIKGHQEWSPTACPGTAQQDFVLPFRAGTLKAGMSPKPPAAKSQPLPSPDYVNRLIVGSYTDPEEMAKALETAKARGYKDAWFSRVKVH